MTSRLDATGLRFRQDYFADPAAFAALADLLREIFDIDIGLLDRFGGPDAGSMPFGYFDADGRCVANFSAFSMPLTISGKAVRAVGYQSGAVLPDYRGRGLYRDLMQRAFGWAGTQAFELGLLLTDKPGLYEAYGFRSVPQHDFQGQMPKSTVTTAPARPLSLDSQADIALIRRLFATRMPVSQVFAAGRPSEFMLNASFDPDTRLAYLPDHDAAVAWTIDKHGVFRLLDVIAAEIPPLAAISGALCLKHAEVTVCFPPDRLGWHATPVPYSGACDLMLNPTKPDAASTDMFMLSPMAEF